ncbi:hypothetical protein [Psychrobacter sp. DAB_AL62B]|uniref:hypothetical protein n=1 Tax=Psychrobacter sp. DAB_AL62B TaxID=1028420 RepID=UPI0023812031|nr:hypothetical protein [Psychrobacter sp. DAB_AL62B]MDE4453979.1 hypothetical protein [Psychrobacter sp. DAB_AL62B]
MSYYNLEQTLKEFQNKLPEKLLPFDLPQLADLCKRGEITPVFPYDKYINVSLGNDHELPTYLKELREPFNGYLTLPKLTDLILQPTTEVTTSTAYIYEEIGKISKGTFVSLENHGYDRFEDYSDGHNSYCNGDINCINVENLLFPIEQVRTYISLKQSNEPDKLTSPAATGTFGNLTAAHGEDKTYEQLVEALTAANSKIKQQDEDIKKLNNQSKEQADKPLRYNSEMGVARMLYAILTEHNYDLSATKGKANSLIEKASQLHGTPVTRNFIAQWIELANQAKSDSTK